jgi:hypothetical protein
MDRQCILISRRGDIALVPAGGVVAGILAFVRQFLTARWLPLPDRTRRGISQRERVQNKNKSEARFKFKLVERIAFKDFKDL